MAGPFVHYLGTPTEVGHHAAPLRALLDVEVAPADQVVQQARPGDVAVFCSEHFERHREAVGELRQRRVATVYAIDGILEWRNAWENTVAEKSCPWTMRPCLADKVAVIGPSQARVLASWGNAERLELIGVPRFDRAVAKRKSFQAHVDRLKNRETIKVLIVTAKCPGFTPEQIETTTRSLVAMRDFFEACERDDRAAGRVPRWQVVWRLTAGLEEELKVQSSIADLTGADLATVLDQVDLVVSTASTVMLEAMLAGRPVALLDFHNVPELVPAAWRIGASEQIAKVLNSMRLCESFDLRRMAWQESLLNDALWCSGRAAERMASLLTRLHQSALEKIESGAAWEFPERFVPWTEMSLDGVESRTSAESLDLATLFPEYPDLRRDDQLALQAELAQARREIRYLRTHLQEAHAVLDRLQSLPLVRGALGWGQRWSAWRERRQQQRTTSTPSSGGAG